MKIIISLMFIASMMAQNLAIQAGPNGLTSLQYRGVEYNYKYGEGLVTSWKTSTGSTYGPPCQRSVVGLTVIQKCSTSAAQATTKATFAVGANDTAYVNIAISNTGQTAIADVTFSVLGLAGSVKNTGLIKVNDVLPVTVVDAQAFRALEWLETPGPDANIQRWCSSSVCKTQPMLFDLQPGSTKTVSVAVRFTTDTMSPLQVIAPEAYSLFAKAYPATIDWPDRRPIMTWFVADVLKTSATNPRGYFQQPGMTVTDGKFPQRAIAYATRVVTAMKSRPVQPQGILVWDLEGQEFIHPTTYIGDPTAFSKGYAPEMNSAADAMFKVFTDAGYRVGITIRPQHLQYGFGSQLPTTCVYSASHDFKDYFIKTDAPWRQAFYACYDPAGKAWTQSAMGNGGQTNARTGDVAAVTAVLKAKIDYARQRWGTTIYYVDSAVWSGGTPLDPSIFLDLQRSYPDSLFIPEQETIGTIRSTIPYSDPRVSTDPRTTPGSWRAAYPKAAMAIDLGDCTGSCWQANYSTFLAGQKDGDIAVYPQPSQISPTHLNAIEGLILTAN